MSPSKNAQTKFRRHNIRLVDIVTIVVVVAGCCGLCDGRLFGAGAPHPGGGEPRGGILFGAAERDRDRDRNREHPGPPGAGVGPGIGRMPPQNILGRLHSGPEDDLAEDGGDRSRPKSDPRHPPKSGRMRLGPILFDPEHLVRKAEVIIRFYYSFFIFMSYRQFRQNFD